MNKVVVIGNGMVGYKFCEKLIEQAPDPKLLDITVIGEERIPAYDRVHLSAYFENKSEEKLLLAKEDWYAQNGINLKLGTLITDIKTTNKTLSTHDNQQIEYDSLVMATGSYPFVPEIDGKDKLGVFVYRTIDDLKAIITYRNQLVGSNPKAVVLGGGLLGLEAAKAAVDLNMKTSVVEFADRLMPNQLDEPGAKTLQRLIESLDIEILVSKNSKTILGEKYITGIEFTDGTQTSADMLIISAGIRPRDELAQKAGLKKGQRGGIIVDKFMKTSIADIYAIGEVASYNNICYGLVAPGYEMAQIVVDQILQNSPPGMQDKIDMSTKLKLIGVDVASFGDAIDRDKKYQSIVLENKYSNIYKRLNISEDGTTLMGGILVGDASDYNNFLQLFKNKIPLGDNPESLLNGPEGSSSIGIDALPDDAIVCTCESVTKKHITDAIQDQKCYSVGDIKKCTKATTGCGGCKPMVADILDYQMETMGLTIKKIICEHFDYTRQELFDIVKFKKTNSYQDLLETHGKGDGCEKCKPVVASIFASIYNETAVVQESIQDTNDRYLANIQKNGSYSVVPRVAGGEITPDQLIAIGLIAKKYNLYTKITGGQRIDMFGADVGDLPTIWKALIDEGFESGHAYGKALRTVKSCVGSTWCRYGLDESVSFAIQLENRYKGIRSPHKLKGGVSGCIRECAEARCKDFGVIATDAGWNLYVCGNGGANPKHAQLLAEGITHQECIKYIDRFLMYYIRTAEPLQRTAAWLDKLKGGLPYLIEVVIDDSLNIGLELEEEMKGLVSSYECEWTQVVNNPDLQQRFKHFINSEEKDHEMKFIPMRGQKVPAPSL